MIARDEWRRRADALLDDAAPPPAREVIASLDHEAAADAFYRQAGKFSENLEAVLGPARSAKPCDRETLAPLAAPHAVTANFADVQPEPPRPLMREAPPADPFPVDALGNVLSSAARAINDKIQAPMAICAQAVLAAATLAVQACADVVLPTAQQKPLSLFFVTVAASGERKTACNDEALWPIRKRETALREEQDAATFAYHNTLDVWDADRKRILVSKGGAHEIAKREALDDLGPPPAAPLSPMLTCPEPTFEGLCKLLAVGQPSVGVFASEGGLFVGGHGMSDENKLRTAAGLSSLWDGEPVRRVRSGDGSMVLPGRRVAMHLMAQPEVSSAFLSDRLLLDQGLLSRILVSAPATEAGRRFWHDPVQGSDAALKRYGARLLDILETPLPLAEGKPNELAPRILPLSLEARKIWISYTDHIERNIGPGGTLEPIRGLANKLPEHAARLAGVVTLAGDPSAAQIDGERMAAGIELVEHYSAEALRLFAAGHTSGELRLAQRLLDWLHREWTDPVVGLPEIYQFGPNPIRDARTARRLAEILAQHGWLIPAEGGAAIDGIWRREAWFIAGNRS